MSKEVFVSYGKNDALDFTDALCQRLEKEKIKVFRDIDRLKAGDRWAEIIVKGIGDSDVFIAVLSKWAMRDPHSPCNDEIGHAAEIGKAIVPVKLMDCDSHFRVKSRQMIELQGWDVEKQLDEGVALVVHVIRTGDYPKSELIDLRNRLKPSDLSTEIGQLLGSFIGREWLVDRIMKKVSEPDTRIVLVEGDPGIGKSSLWAELVRRGGVHAYYRCKHGDVDRSNPGLFLRTIAYHLAVDRSWYRKQIQHKDLPEAITDMVSALLATPMRENPQQLPIVIAIDALDEAHDAQGRIPLAKLIRELAMTLPPNVRFIITCRPDAAIRSQLPGPVLVRIETASEENVSDIDKYLVMRSKGIRFMQRVKDPAAVRKLVSDKAHGNFLFAVNMMNAIEKGSIDPNNHGAYPNDMNAFFLDQFQRALPDQSSFVAIEPFLDVICAALQPVGPKAIAAITGVDPEDVEKGLDPLSALILLEDGLYVPFHKSLVDWLLRSGPGSGQFAAHITKGHRAIIKYCRSCLQSGRGSKHYDVTRLPDHLLAIDDDEGLANYLSDPGTLDHIDLSDPHRVRSLWEHGSPANSRGRMPDLAESLVTMLQQGAATASPDTQLARTIKVAHVVSKLEVHQRSRPLYEAALALLAGGAKCADADLGELRMDLGIALRNLGEYDLSETNFAEAGSLIKAGHGEDSRLFAMWCYRYATLLWEAGRSNKDKDSMWARSHSLYQQAASRMKDDGDPQLLPELLNDHSVLLDNMGRHEEAVAMCERGLKLLDRAGIASGTVAAELHGNLAAHQYALYLSDFVKSLQRDNPLQEIRDRYVTSRDLFAAALGPNSDRGSGMAKRGDRMDGLIAHVGEFRRVLKGTDIEVLKFAMQNEVITRTVAALLLPADLTNDLIGLYTKTESAAILRSLIELQCAMLHFRDGEGGKMSARFDPPLDFWRKTGANGVVSRLLINYYFMLDHLKLHDKAGATLRELLDLMYSGNTTNTDEKMLMVYLGYLRTHSTAREAVDVIDRIQAGRLFPQFRSLPALSRIKGSILYSLGEFGKAAEQQDLYVHELLVPARQDDAAYIHAVVSAGLYQKSAGQFDKALVSYQEALSLSAKKNSGDRLMEAHIRGNIASLYRDHGDLQPAVEEMNAVVEIIREAHGSDHELCAHELLKRASVLLLVGEYAQARNDLAQAMLILETRYAPSTPSWHKARGLELLGISQSADGEAEEACATFAQGIEQYEASRGTGRPVDRDKCELILDLGRCLHAYDLAGAYEAFDQARSTLRPILGEEHYLTRTATCWMMVTQAVAPGSSHPAGMRDLVADIAATIGARHPHVLELEMELALRTNDLESMEKALKVIDAHESKIAFLKARANAGYARLLFAHGAGHLQQARALCEKAIGLFESIRPSHALGIHTRTLMKAIEEA